MKRQVFVVLIYELCSTWHRDVVDVKVFDTRKQAEDFKEKSNLECTIYEADYCN